MSPSPVSRRIALAALVAALNLGALAGLMSLSRLAAADSAPAPAPAVPSSNAEPAPPVPPPVVIAEVVEPPPVPAPPLPDPDQPHLLDQVMPIEDFGGY